LIYLNFFLSVSVFFNNFRPDIRCIMAVSVSQYTLTAAAEAMNGF